MSLLHELGVRADQARHRYEEAQECTIEPYDAVVKAREALLMEVGCQFFGNPAGLRELYTVLSYDLRMGSGYELGRMIGNELGHIIGKRFDQILRTLPEEVTNGAK